MNTKLWNLGWVKLLVFTVASTGCGQREFVVSKINKIEDPVVNAGGPSARPSQDDREDEGANGSSSSSDNGSSSSAANSSSAGSSSSSGNSSSAGSSSSAGPVACGIQDENCCVASGTCAAAPDVDLNCDFGMGLYANGDMGAYGAVACVAKNKTGRKVTWKIEQLRPVAAYTTTLSPNATYTLNAGETRVVRWYVFRTGETASLLPYRAQGRKTPVHVVMNAKISEPGYESKPKVVHAKTEIEHYFQSVWMRLYNRSSGQSLGMERVHNLPDRVLPNIVVSALHCTCQGHPYYNPLNIAVDEAYRFPWYAYNRVDVNGCYLPKECTGEVDANPAPSMNLVGTLVNADGSARANNQFNSGEFVRIKWSMKNNTAKAIVIDMGCTMISESGDAYGCDKGTQDNGHSPESLRAKTLNPGQSLDVIGNYSPALRHGNWSKGTRYSLSATVLGALRDEDSGLTTKSAVKTIQIN